MRNGSSRLTRDMTIASPSTAMQQAGHRAQGRRREQPPADARDHEHRERAADGRREPPRGELPTPPPTWIPSAISHLPICGCTTYSPTSVSPLVLPASNAGLGLSPHCASKPLTSSEHASLT